MFAKRLERLTKCFLQLGENHLENIRQLTALCGEEMAADCALYNRLKGNLLHAIGQWQTPPGFIANDSPNGHICYDVIKSNSDETVLIRNLSSSPYAETDPNVRAYSLQTYIGHAVRCEGKAVGSLCVVYKTDCVPSEEDCKIMSIIATAIGHEDTRWKSKEELNRHASLLKASLEATADGILVVSTEGRIVEFNTRFADMWHMPDSLLALCDDNAALDFVSSQIKDYPKFIECVKSIYLQPEAHSIDTVELNDGRVFERLSCPQRHDNKVIGRVWSFRDVTAQKNAEAALMNEKTFTESALNILRDVFYVFDLNGRFLRWNKALSECTGFSDEEIARMKPTDFFAKDEHQAVINAIQKVVTDGSATLETTVLTKDGRQLPYEHTASLLSNSDGQPIGISGVGRNLTDRKKLEEQLLQAQKMEAVGQLAGGIAHDFNNILSAIMGYASILQMKLGTESPLSKNVNEILKAAQRAAQLTSGLLAFSRKQNIMQKPVELNALVRDIHKLLSMVIGENIELVLNIADYSLVVMADSAQIEHAIINLATNARDAMPNGGRLTITTCKHAADSPAADKSRSIPCGKYALLSISDTGTGLEEAHKDKIFEPFFTTKGVGKGTGLGLAMVYGAIKQHKGYIDVDSCLGKGATFRIFLPLSTQHAKAYEDKSQMPAYAMRTSGTVLIVEDEEAVRRIMRILLEQSGYSVIEASDGVDALVKLRQNGTDIKLLVTDVIMPKMDGVMLCSEAKKIKPGLRSLFISGYHDKIPLDSTAWQNGCYLSKPFTSEQFLEAVRKAVDN
ncbi:MAG TPA: PAS domain S-box protein [Dissulfurispiraceae bacterium]|nr:PAS domain S-box protein [Dissulfurispiraceae bacterium]